MSGNKIRGSNQIMEGTITANLLDPTFLANLYTADLFTGDGVTTIYQLTETPIISTLLVIRRGLVLAALRGSSTSNDDYLYNPTTNQITMTSAVDSGDSLEFRYWHNP